MKRLYQMLVLAVFGLVFLGGVSSLQAQAISSAASGDWNDPAVWAGGVVPSTGNDVTILAGHVVTLNQNATIRSLATAGTGHFRADTSGTYTLTLTTPNGGNILNVPATGTFNAVATGSQGNGRINVVFTNSTTGAIVNAGTMTFNNVTVSGTVTTVANFTVQGDFEVTGANSFAAATTSAITFDGASTKTITRSAAGTLTFFTLTMANTGGNKVQTASSFTIAGDFTNNANATFEATDGTITFTAAAALATINNNAIADNCAFFNVTLNPGATFDITLAAGDQVTVRGNMIKSGADDVTGGALSAWIFKNVLKKTITVSGAGVLNFDRLVIADGSKVDLGSAGSDPAGTITITGDNAAPSSELSILGTGQLRALSGLVTFSGATNADISVSASGSLVLWDLTAATPLATSSSFAIADDFTQTGVLTATGGTITFSGTAGSIAGAGPSSFFNVNIANIDINTVATVTTTANFVVTGNFTVGSGSSFVASGASDIDFDNTTQKSITNNGTLTFATLTVTDAATSLATTSSFTVSTIFDNTVGGAFSATGGSTITIAGGAASFVSDAAASIVTSFQNVRFTGAATPATGFAVKGNFIIDGTGTFVPTAGTITFNGSGTQTIGGNTTGTNPFDYFNVTVNKAAGDLVLLRNIRINGAAGALTLTNGDIDLNGDRTITLNTTTTVLAETAGNTVKNTVDGTGHITTAAGLTDVEVVGSGLGITALAGTTPPTGLTVRRYHNPKEIFGVNGIERYYEFNVFGAGTATQVTIQYDNTELNGATAANLGTFVSNTAPGLAPWTALSGTSTPGANTGTVAVTTDFTLGVAPAFVAVAGKSIILDEALSTLGTTPTGGGLAVSPLTASATGTQSGAILGFSLQSSGSATFTGVTINLSSNPSGKLQNWQLRSNTVNNSTTATAVTGAAYNVTTNSIEITGITGETFPAAGQTRYYFLFADVTVSVGSGTSQIQASVASTNVTVTSAAVQAETVTGPNYAFRPLNVSVSNSNTPPSTGIAQGANNARIFGFSLTGTTPATATVTSVTIGATLAAGAVSTNFSDFSLFEDLNNNGIVDGGDGAAIVSGVNIVAGSVTFTGLTQALTGATTTRNYLVTADVAGAAPVGGTIRLAISNTPATILVNSPAQVVSGGPFNGSIMTVAASAAPTRLVIRSIAPVTPANITGQTTNVVEDGNGATGNADDFNVIVEAQDANGVLQNVTVATQVNLSVSVGTSALTTVAAGTRTMPINTNSITFAADLNATPSETGVELTAADNAATLSSGTYSGITVRATQPTTVVTALTVSSINANSATIGWTAAGATDGSDVIVVVRQGATPSAPTDGFDYNPATGNSFATPAATFGSTAIGSVVTHKIPVTAGAMSATINGLNPGQEYSFTVIGYNGTSTGTNYFLTNAPVATATTYAAEPTAPSTNIAVSGRTTNSMTLTWTSGNGANRIVVARAVSAVAVTPTDAVTYDASASFGASGTELGTGNVVYSGSGNTVTLTNLAPNTQYHFAIYEYNGTGVATNYYLVGAPTASATTLHPEPTIQTSTLSFSSVGSSSVIVNMTPGNGQRRLIVARAGQPVQATDFPTDGMSYTASATFGTTAAALGSSFVVYNNTGNSVTVTGLAFGTPYYFRAFEYSGETTSPANDVNANYLATEVSGNPAFQIADANEPNDTYATARPITDPNGGTQVVTGHISTLTDEDYLSFNAGGVYPHIRMRLINLPVNYNLELYAPNGDLLRRSRYRDTTEEVIVVNNASAGTYVLRVFGVNGASSTALPYTLLYSTSSIPFESATP